MSAAAVMAQLSPALSDQRISSGAPGTLKTFFGFMALRSHTTIVLPKLLHRLRVLDQLAERAHVVV